MNPTTPNPANPANPAVRVSAPVTPVAHAAVRPVTPVVRNESAVLANARAHTTAPVPLAVSTNIPVPKPEPVRGPYAESTETYPATRKVELPVGETLRVDETKQPVVTPVERAPLVVDNSDLYDINPSSGRPWITDGIDPKTGDRLNRNL